MPYHGISYHILAFHIHTISKHFTPHHGMSYHMAFHTTSYFIPQHVAFQSTSHIKYICLISNQYHLKRLQVWTPSRHQGWCCGSSSPGFGGTWRLWINDMVVSTKPSLPCTDRMFGWRECCKWHWQQGTFLCGDLRSFGAICLWQFKGFRGSDAKGACRPPHIQWRLWSCWRMGD